MGREHGAGVPGVEVLDRGNGIKTRLLVGKHNGGSVTTGTTLLAGQAATWHSHNCAEQIMLLEGRHASSTWAARSTSGHMTFRTFPAESRTVSSTPVKAR